MLDGLDFSHRKARVLRLELPAQSTTLPAPSTPTAAEPTPGRETDTMDQVADKRDRLDDAHFPAYTMSAAAALLGVQPGFLRGLGEAGLLAPARSSGGHRRYSRDDLKVAARARQIVDDGMNLAAACRIVQLEI